MCFSRQVACSKKLKKMAAGGTKSGSCVEQGKVQVCICVLCGLPTAGKTSLLNSLKLSLQTLEQVGQLKFAVVGIEYDSLLSVSEHQEVKEWKLARRQVLTLVRNLIPVLRQQTISMECPDGVSCETWSKFGPVLQEVTRLWNPGITQVLVVIDDNMYLRSMRYEYFQLSRELSTGFCQVYLEHGVAEAIRANQTRGSVGVTCASIQRMGQSLEPPDGSRFWWEKQSITLQPFTEGHIQKVASLVQTALEKPSQAVEERGAAPVHSELHKADLVLRKCVSSWLAECQQSERKETLQQQSKKAHEIKVKVLTALRNSSTSRGLDDEQIQALFYSLVNHT
ncbi:L-seryl-tRNA(Sec) kinase-like isoform X2 [Physella acuta]|uniref:L-seryl-tRNA(Sec) kinase-like isoform X2 n=1 Tax=Physella acuta TaxID=109671 RepID=UPI0027DD527B|nr:L-seryl-tRNA(Sec) kinase-like isoform X2 [Physella acuta]